MEFKEIVMQRFAARKFNEKKIPQSKIDELIEIIRYSASAVNLQPWKIKVIEDQKTKDELMKAAFNQPQAGNCSHLLAFCADTDINALVERLDRTLKAAGAPAEAHKQAIMIAKMMAGSLSPANTVVWAQCQVYLALGNAINGAKSLGLDSCPMTGFDPEKCSQILKLPKHLVLTALCPLGYAAEAPAPKVRFAKEDILF